MSFAAQIGGIVLALVVSGLIAWVGSSGSIGVSGLPLFFVCVLLAFAMQWLFFVHSWLKRSEKLFDLVGSITFVTVALVALVVAGRPCHPRANASKRPPRPAAASYGIGCAADGRM